ncbi:MAG: DNA topoisomerase IV subunit A [Desulfomonile sp.]|nr:DNA topoisomerase IV subunit A [Desulfomonile sp.]
MNSLISETGAGEKTALLHEEVEKRYLAYALSTIVSRALPDVRDGLKPVHRRILYAMHVMGLGDAAKMRKSAAVVGEVIGKYHPHGDQAAYDALVRMAQDFSLRYPLIEGSGNFGSLDGDSPAAMRYTETRLSGFSSTLLREIDQGTTDFRPTYDGMGQEPDVLPSGVPNLLLNGSSGIAVGMSCSFPPHNLDEVVAACRASIRNPNVTTEELLAFVKGPDFPTGGEILNRPEHLLELYSRGLGSIPVRGTFEVEPRRRGAANLIITSIPYSVNKARLIERIAQLIRDKRLKYVHDIRDESTDDVRIVIELKGSDAKPEQVMAFLYRHTDLEINFPVNFIAITPQGVPDRLGLAQIIRYFLDFRFEKTVRWLEHRLAILRKRIHVLEGFARIFDDLDQALAIIRSARSRKEAEEGLKTAFDLDNEQVDAILETRLYRLVALEIGKLLEELSEKRQEASLIERDLASPARIWKIIDNDLAQTAKKFGDPRRTLLVEEQAASAREFDPNEFVEHDNVTVILSKHGWVRRMKMEVEQPSSLKFREGDAAFGWVRVNTDRTLALFSNRGKVYVMRAFDIPATSGFGEPLGSILSLEDGEAMVGLIAPDPAVEISAETGNGAAVSRRQSDPDSGDENVLQEALFEEFAEKPSQPVRVESPAPQLGIIVTRSGKGFRFAYDALREPTKRIGRKMVNLQAGDEVAFVKPVEGSLVAVAADSGHVLVFPADQVPIIGSAAQGVRMIRLAGGAAVVGLETASVSDELRIQSAHGEERIVSIRELPQANRDGRGRPLYKGIQDMELIRRAGGAAS